MAEIPYFFETPIPKYFRETGWFSNPNTILFVTWAFSKCSPDARTIVHDGKEMTLAPYEFITGRGKSSADCFLTEGALRNQLISMQKAGLLKKTTNSVTNRYTCYIWLTERFSKNNNQLNNQQTTNSQPTEQPQSRRKKIISKDSHPSIPSVNRDEGKMNDDFSSKEEEEEQKTEVYQGIFLTKDELDACIKIKGDIDKVKHAIAFIQTSKKRKHPISDWPNALSKWKIENKVQARIEDNIGYADKLCKTFENYVKGWRCYMYTDKKKDQRGILFEPQSAYAEAVFISLIDGEFQQKCYEVLRSKGMIPEKVKD